MKPSRRRKAAPRDQSPKRSKTSKAKMAKRTLTRARIGCDKPGKSNDISWHEHFITVLGTTANVAAACRAVKISRNTAYDHREKFEDFRERWVEAEAFALDGLYTIGLEHATNGTKRKIYQRGKEVGEETVYDHRLLEWLLERKRPTEFSSKQKVEHVGNITLTPDKALELAQKREMSIIATMKAAAGIAPMVHRN